jgi:hypothetical protein
VQVLENYSKDLGSSEDLEVLIQVLSSLWRVYYSKKRVELDSRGIEEGSLHVEDEHLHEEMRVVSSLVESAKLRQLTVFSMARMGTDGYCVFYVVPEGNHGWHIHVKVKAEDKGSYRRDGSPFPQNGKVEKQVSDRVKAWMSDSDNLGRVKSRLR